MHRTPVCTSPRPCIPLPISYVRAVLARCPVMSLSAGHVKEPAAAVRHTPESGAALAASALRGRELPGHHHVSRLPAGPAPPLASSLLCRVQT